MLIENHRLLGVTHFESPHADDRPRGCNVELVVVHGISLPPGEFGGPAVHELFMGGLSEPFLLRFPDLRGVRVSSHVFITRLGEALQFVPFDRRAWHAGSSRWRGRDRCNDFSVGIELEGTDDLPYEVIQYRVLADVVRALRSTYGTLHDDALVGHEHIAPGRKSDPGPAFDWALLTRCIDQRPHATG